MENDLMSVTSLSSHFEISRSTIYRWIKKGKLNARKSENQLIVINDEQFDNCIREMIEWNYDKNYTYIPDELKQYEYWHQNIDYFAWLIKICYSSKNDIKRKRFRMDTIFQNYITKNNITIKRVRNLFRNNVFREKDIFEDLKRGWYNELAFSFPLKESTIGCSFSDIRINYDLSSDRFLFPSWKIVESYYSIYFFLRSIALMKNSTFRRKEHKATLNCFKNNVIPILSKSLWGFPFNIEYNPKHKVYRNKIFLAKLDYIKYRYCLHSRSPYLNPNEIFEYLLNNFKKRGKSFNTPAHYTFFDFFLEFRVWSNYLDISNLLSLYGKGYKSFLDQNLSLILFIISGIAEISIIAKFGANKYNDALQELYNVFTTNNVELKKNFVNVSIYQRMKIYKNLGFIDKTITMEQEENINDLLYLNNGM